MNAMKSFGFIFLDSTVCTLDVMVHTYGQLPNELVDKHIMQILSDLLCFMNLFSHVERTPFVILIFHSTQKNIPTLKSYNIFCGCKKLFYPSTLMSLINVGLRLFFLRKYSRPYAVIPDPTFIYF